MTEILLGIGIFLFILLICGGLEYLFGLIPTRPEVDDE